MDCSLMFASAVRLLGRDTMDVAPLILPLLASLILIASTIVALVQGPGAKKWSTRQFFQDGSNFVKMVPWATECARK